MSAELATSKREERRDERRELILDVARGRFLADGYAATSMSAIAARLGGSKGTLYNYFRNKEDLFAAVMQRQCAELQASLFDVDGQPGDAKARLTHFARRFLELLMSPHAVAIQRLVVAEGERFPELGRVFYESGPRVVMARMGEHLEELMDKGLLRRADPLVAAQHLKDLAVSGVYLPKLWGVLDKLTDEDAERQVARAVDTFLRAYAP
jgi:AcrR family transcriptional regulator